MTVAFHRRGADKLQKFFLYLILLDWVLLLITAIEMQSLSFRYGAIISVMLLVYNVFLTHLCRIRARRANDAYMIYPVMTGALISFLLVTYFFFFI
ncbi:hypothetical protein LZP73_08265 [Shewanella sp. AS16]|uniref:hypothetical protein n=1 Tax=Shewanella sp. AS16 TaxID=2907625 RepID=UPI001F20157C|nr:hypothetical protein [Shewanella sp. AS16]MCE9686211.1 hypothetical protein [Shewanella sp. AS16]